MKKTVSLVLLVILTGCASSKVNLAFQLMGIYDDEVEISKLQKDNKEVLFIPMHHIGTKLFYADVNRKVDSLEKLGYFFYTERVKGAKNDTLTFLKFRKITGITFSKKNANYLEMFDSLYNGKVKYKKELIDQPFYKDIGVDSLKSRNVDVAMNTLINYYETKYGEIRLEECDYKTPLDRSTPCKKEQVKEKNFNDAILNYRNAHVIEELQKDTRQKIAIIYGANHFIGIREELVKLGYK